LEAAKRSLADTADVEAVVWA